jgi:hypothetical protein
MENFEMEYNSRREELIIPEYGRNIQNLIRYAKTIEDRRHRQAYVEKIINLMMQMHPQNRNADDYRERLWKHLFHIANYELDVTPPGGIVPRPEDAKKKPERVPYPRSEARFRHYGNHVQRLIEKALAMEKGAKREGLVSVIGSYMKLAYRTWNKEHYVSDEVIKTDLLSLSGEQLVLHDDASIDGLANSNRRRNPEQNRSGSNTNRRPPNPGGGNRPYQQYPSQQSRNNKNMMRKKK